MYSCQGGKQKALPSYLPFNFRVNISIIIDKRLKYHQYNIL